ncbi:MAG: hypothetical protein ABI697_01770 [Devosia sp.]
MAESDHPTSGSSAASKTHNGTGAASRARAQMDEGDVEAQVAQLQADIKQLTTTLGQLGQTTVTDFRTGAERSARDLAQRGQSALNMAQDEFTAVEKQVKDTIREKPLTAVAAAVAAGFILAVLTR